MFHDTYLQRTKLMMIEAAIPIRPFRATHCRPQQPPFVDRYFPPDTLLTTLPYTDRQSPQAVPLAAVFFANTKSYFNSVLQPLFFPSSLKGSLNSTNKLPLPSAKTESFPKWGQFLSKT